jgi:hypothetical protein
MGCAMAAPAAAQAQAAPAQPAPAPAAPFPPPRAFPGYTHPNITDCRTVSPARRECTVPAKVAGHYLIEAVGIFTATGPNPAVAINIVVGNQICMSQGGHGFTGRAPLHIVCEVTLATDAPITIAVNVAGNDATLEPTGPLMGIGNEVWDGVISARGSDGGPLPGAKPQTPPPPPPVKQIGKPPAGH